MDDIETVVNAGRLVMFDSGEYSDYSVTGFFVVLKEFNPVEELEIFLTQNPNQRERYGFEKSAFIAFVIAKGLLLEIEYSEIYLGAYDSSDSFRFRP